MNLCRPLQRSWSWQWREHPPPPPPKAKDVKPRHHHASTKFDFRPAKYAGDFNIAVSIIVYLFIRFLHSTILQVYIVAMKQRDNPSPGSGAEGEDQFPESSGSLLELVEPELKSLSKYWLGALRDHALLALPTEYSSQLPPQGGMFYR